MCMYACIERFCARMCTTFCTVSGCCVYVDEQNRSVPIYSIILVINDAGIAHLYASKHFDFRAASL